MQRILDTTDRLCAVVDYEFRNQDLLIEALTHSSVSQDLGRHKTDVPWNERLEFLGDSVLGLVLSTELMSKNKDLPEGDLSKVRAALVNESMLHQLGTEIQLNRYLLLGQGEEKAGGRLKPSVIADAFEAMLGAIYLDSGFENVRYVILGIYEEILQSPLKNLLKQDFKSRLQELTQDLYKSAPSYKIVKKQGPDHCAQFTVEAWFQGSVIGAGEGSSKKAASQKAAEAALIQVKKDPQILEGDHP